MTASVLGTIVGPDSPNEADPGGYVLHWSLVTLYVYAVIGLILAV